MKIKASDKIVPKGYIGITLWPFGIYLREKYMKHKKTINHEKIHWEQQKELAGLFFYVLYGIEFVIKLLITGEKYYAYKNLSSEIEANKFEADYKYLKNRKRYNWLKYIFTIPLKK